MDEKKRRALKALAVGLITGLSGVLFGLTDWGVDFERGVGLSWLFSVRGPIAPPDDVVVVAINSQTGEQLGLSSLPREWPRRVHARMVDELTRRGASAIVFDMQFDKPRNATDDGAFAAAVDASDRVVLIELITGKRQPLTDGGGRQTGSVWIEELIEPIPVLGASAKGLATFPLPKIDASVYEFWAFKESVGDAPTLPAVALQIHALRAYPAWRSLLDGLQAPGVSVLPRTAEEIGKAARLREMMRGMRGVFHSSPQAGDRLAGLIAQSSGRQDAEDMRLAKALLGLYAGPPHRMINFYGPPGSIATIPYQHVLKGVGEQDALDLKGKTVFIGFSDLYDPGQPDRFYTVFTSEDGVDLSGVEIAATAFANLLTDRSIRPMDGLHALAVVLAFGVVIGSLAYFLPAILGVPLAIALAVAYAWVAQGLFDGTDLWVPLATPLLAQFPLALFLGLLGQYLLERRRGQRIGKALAYYLPEHVARDLTENRGDPQSFNKVVYGTCLATDMSGFSTISEQLLPDQLARFLNDYFDTLAGALKRHHVDVTEFRADAIMCAWTADRPTPAVRRQAVLAALEAAKAIEGFKKRHAMFNASLRIGLEAGHFYIGHAGGGGHFVFSIVGDTANTASRIESLNKHLGTHILATQDVVEGVEGLLLRHLGDFVFVGKTETTPIVEIMADAAQAEPRQRQLAERFAAALALFHGADWTGAEAALAALQADYPDDGPARFYLARCRAYLGGAPLPEDA
nr:adenylate/guanylate cyclase domain-containing protein [Thiobacillaceae bacterium]